jgi:hypothetical protein
VGNLAAVRVLRRALPLGLAALLATGALATSAPAPAHADPLPAYPKMYVEPFCFDQVGLQNITVRGRNFTPGAKLVVTDFVHMGDYQGGWAVNTAADEYGNFVVRMSFTTTTTAPNVRLDAIEQATEHTVTSAFVSGCGGGPTLEATPGCADPANPVIQVHGEGWLDSGAILIELAKDNVAYGNSVRIKAVPTFNVSFSPGVTLDPGQYLVRASWSSGEFYELAYDYFVTPCPQVTIRPICSQRAGAPPDRLSILVTGVSGWLQGTADGYDEIQIVFDLFGHPQEFFFSANPYEGETGVTPEGSFATLEINPYLRPDGVYTIQVKQQGYGEDPITQVQLPFSVPCANPTVTATPRCGPPQIVGDVPKTYEVTVTGTDFAPGQKVTVVFDPDFLAGSDYSPETFSGVTGRDGSFTLPINPAYRPPGTYRILAYQDLSFGRYEASTSFPVPCRVLTPTLTVDPVCAPAASGKPGAYKLNLVGSGFVWGFVELVFDPTGTPETGGVQTDRRGSFSTTLVVNGRPPGAYAVIARQTTVLGPLDEASVSVLVPCEGTILRIMPSAGPRGFVPRAEGFGFPALTFVELRWDYGIGAGRPISVLTDQNGNFSRQLVIFQHDFTGPRKLTVQLPGDPLAFNDLEAPYSVTVGTVTPPFVVDNPFGPPDPIVIRR